MSVRSNCTSKTLRLPWFACLVMLQWSGSLGVHSCSRRGVFRPTNSSNHARSASFTRGKWRSQLPFMSSTSSPMLEASSPRSTPKDSEKDTPAQVKDNPNKIVVSSELEVDIPIDVAFDAFADLPRQPSWSPWLRSVEYSGPPGNEQSETLWKMRYMGFSMSWNSKTVQMKRPNVIAWESTRGLKNFGLIEFQATSEHSTHVKLTMTFLPPRFLNNNVMGFRRMTRVIEDRMLQTTLKNFRDIVVENDLKRD